jgi:hypothetical protein
MADPHITIGELDALCDGHMLGPEMSIDALAAGEGYVAEHDFARDLIALIRSRRAEGDQNAEGPRSDAVLSRMLGVPSAGHKGGPDA